MKIVIKSIDINQIDVTRNDSDGPEYAPHSIEVSYSALKGRNELRGNITLPYTSVIDLDKITSQIQEGI